jgi:hypothetical protein
MAWRWQDCRQLWSHHPCARRLGELAGLPGDHIEKLCKAHAIDWAAQIEGGQPASKVVPGNIIGAILGAPRKASYGAHEHKVKIERILGDKQGLIAKR